MQSAVFRRAFALCALLLAPAALRAQETGKVEGRVVDQTGQPVVGAQVLVVGTRFGNITNPQGYYFINNVPAGLQDVQAQFIGYQTVTVRQQRLLAGQTTTLNFTLAQSAVAVQAIEVVGERTPLVPRDQVASKNIVTGELVQELPTDNVRQVLVLQPGVVETNRRSSGISIRGGRSGEEATFIDGVLVRNFGSGANHLVVGTNAVAEADVLTGGFSAQFGDAQSGVINLVTRTGGQRWTGATSIQTDEMMPKQYSLGLSRGELSLGGPLFGNFSFFGAATAQGQRSINVGKLYRDLPIYVPAGVDTTVTLTTPSTVTGLNDVREVSIPKYSLYDQGGRLPFSNGDQYTLDGKLNYSYGSGSRVFFTAKSSRQQARQSPILGASGLLTEGVTTLYDPQGYGGTRQLANTLIFGLTHNFVRSADSELSLDLKLSLSNDELNAGALDHSWEVTHRDPALGFTLDDFQFAVEADCHGRSTCREFPVNEELVHNMLTNSGRLAPFQQDQSVTRTQEFRLNPYGVATGFPTAGFSTAGWTYQRERDKQARAAIDWQANRYNRIKFGGDYTDIDIRRADYNSLTDLSFARAYVENPKRISAFGQDRVDLGDVVIEAGVRWDHFDPNTDYPIIPGYYNPDDPTTFTHINAENAVSPRLGVSFPVTVNSTFRLSYGHFVQVPELNVYYRGKNTDFFRFKNTNTNDIFGRPLALGKTIAFEFGYRQLLAPDFVLDIAAYNKDKKADAALRKLPVSDPTNPGAINYLNTFTNADYGNIRGVDARLDRRFGNFLQAMLAYSYQDARNTGTDPFTYTALFARIEGNANQILGQPAAPPNSIRPTEENRKHNITGTFAVTVPSSWSGTAASVLHNVGLFGTMRFASGLPFTQVTDVGQNFIIGPPFALGNVGRLLNGDINTATTPWIKQIDLKVSKGFTLARFNAQAFIDARNVFDFQNQNSVFLTTGGLGDEQVMQSFIRSAQTSVGGGTIRDVDLSSLAAAGGGVTNIVNLIALRRSEALFGNGDLTFTQAEQAKAFRQATYISNDLATVVDPGRRLRVGIDLTF